jgi:galactose-6-phosphate isomerase
MPLLDVSDVLDDPDFADDSLICKRNPQTMGEDGRAISVPVAIPFSAVVTAMSGEELRRGPDGEYITGSISIITRFTLFSGKTGFSADVIEWNGRSYTIADVQDYSRYGSGFVQAVGDLIPLAG